MTTASLMKVERICRMFPLAKTNVLHILEWPFYMVKILFWSIKIQAKFFINLSLWVF